MNIAISVCEPTLEGRIHEDFQTAPFLLVVNMEDMSCESIARQGGTDLDLARIILERRCEAVITGQLSNGSFLLLADEGVTRYRAHGLSAGEALEAMERRELDFIRNADGSDSCEGSHHHGLEDLRVCSGHTH